jgi:RNA polymerase sigma-70 factor (ECF subfamily)
MQPTIEYIVENFQAGLQRLCLGYVYDPEEAKDLVQEVLVKVWTYLPEFRGEANVKTWVYRIAVNTCLMHLRKKRLPTVPLIQERDVTQEEASSEDERFGLLRSAISSLPARDRILILLFLDEHSYEQIAGVMGLSVSNVGARLTRIRKKLSTLLKSPTHG